MSATTSSGPTRTRSPCCGPTAAAPTSRACPRRQSPSRCSTPSGPYWAEQLVTASPGTRALASESNGPPPQPSSRGRPPRGTPGNIQQAPRPGAEENREAGPPAQSRARPPPDGQHSGHDPRRAIAHAAPAERQPQTESDDQDDSGATRP